MGRLQSSALTPIALAALAALIAGAAAVAEPCNPVIDGTYCASQPPRAPASTPRPGVRIEPIQSLARDLSLPQDSSPTTFGAITFSRTGTRCIGLLRRGACD